MAPASGGRLDDDRETTRRLFAELADPALGTEQRAERRQRLVEIHLPLAHHLARRFQDRGEPLDDLVQAGTIGLIKAVDRFDPQRGVEFSTYATPTIIGEIKRHFRDSGWSIRVPRRLQELRSGITRATADLAQRNGRSPTVAELAVALGVDEDDVLEGLESAGAYSTLSLDTTAEAAGSVLGTEDGALAEIEHREAIRPMLWRLPSRERRILELRFFAELTQSQIAEEIGISQMHVSRLLAKTLLQMRTELSADET